MNGYLFWIAGWLFTLGTISAIAPETLKDYSFWESMVVGLTWPVILGAYFAG